MNNLNSVLLEGNLVRDPELNYTGKGTPVCNFSVASNRFYKQEDELQKETSFFDVTVWSRQAEVCKEYLTKGRGVRVVGRLKQDRWQDSEGKNKSKVLVVAEHVEFKPVFKNGDRRNDEADAAAEGAGKEDDAAEQEELKDAASL
jgi:single-strand DNA-binding protein